MSSIINFLNKLFLMAVNELKQETVSHNQISDLLEKWKLVEKP